MFIAEKEILPRVLGIPLMIPCASEFYRTAERAINQREAKKRPRGQVVG